MVDLEVLKAMGSTQERLREIFTAVPPPSKAEREGSEVPGHGDAPHLSEKEVKRIEENCKIREQFEADINRRFSENINYAVANYQMYSAIDYAWDAAPINKETYPLLLYAQGKLDLGNCAKQIKDLPCADKYTTKNANGEIVSVDVPKFFEVNFNLVRSVITRRLAAQANKYNSLYPHYKYEPRSTSMVAKLRADVLSQVMDIMTDQFDYRHHDLQVLRDVMLYGHCVDFVRSKWEKEEHQIFDPDINPDLKSDEKPRYKTVVTKEGVGWVNPHPSRIFWDNAYPLSSINTDTGCEFIGFWDVIRYGDIVNNPNYWNRTTISYSATIVQLFSTYAQYFSQYYCTIRPPCDLNEIDLSAPNDRLNNLGLYSQDMQSSSMIIGNYFKKIVPKDWKIGGYPYPVWLRMVIAGDKTVVYSEFLPSTPASYDGFNENDSRQLNISIGMELLPYQDQMTQLLSLLMYTLQACNIKVIALDVDQMSPEQIKAFRTDMEAKNKISAVKILEYSGTKYRELGINPKEIIAMVETQPGQAITIIFQAMAQLVQLSERLMALSPHELGQPAPREISATETNMMAGTTETMYGFISDAHDEFRAAKKRILYESYMVCGSQTLRVPVVNRYTKATIEKAGFELLDEDAETFTDPSIPHEATVLGTKSKLYYEYVYTTRDGALRSVNTQAANALVQLLGVLNNPIFMQKVKPSKLYEIANEIFRLSGTGVDLKLELDEGEPDTFGPDQMQQIQQTLQALTQNAEQEQQANQKAMQAIQQLAQKFEALLEEVKGLAEAVDEVSKRPTTVQVDPMKFLQGQQNLAADRQKMRHAEEKHVLDMGLEGMKAMREDRESRSRAYAK